MSRHHYQVAASSASVSILTESKDITVISRKAALSDITEQDRIINEVESMGYQHYETLNLGGNEVLFRFRKRLLV